MSFELGDYIEVYGTQLAKMDYIFVHELDQRRAFAVVRPLIDIGQGQDRILGLPLVRQTQDQRIIGLPAIGPRKPYIVNLDQEYSTGKNPDILARADKDGQERGQAERDLLLVHCNWQLYFL